MPVIITDRDHIISFSGIAKKEVFERRISHGLENLMENRSAFIASTGNKESLLPIDNSDIRAAVAFPIIGNVFLCEYRSFDEIKNIIGEAVPYTC